MIKILKNFLTAEECQQLNEIAIRYFRDGILQIGGYGGRYTTRHVHSSFKFDPFVYEISTKIRRAANIDKYALEYPRGKDGVNVAVTIKDGYIALHTDPRAEDGSVTYRCNVITQKSDIGGDLIMDGKVVDLGVGDVHCYAVSEIPHIVTATEGSTPRILWMFGAHIPLADWNNNKIRMKNVG